MKKNQRQKAETFRALHEGAGSFMMPNAWDGGSAKVLARQGFLALATSSGACAGTLGRVDGKVSREEALAHAQLIAGATDLPVSADLENGFGDAPETVAETIRLAGGTGLAGASIEDSPGGGPMVYDFAHAVERVVAAVEAARSLPFRFVLTARAENHVRGQPNLDDTIRRLQAFERAGADVLFAPGLPDLAAVRAVCAAVTKPVNFMVGIRGTSFSVAELTAAGVKRISLAASLYRAAKTRLVEVAREVHTAGTFTYLDQTMTSAQLGELLSEEETRGE
jgi:2-methylisocitrate lyase-like PEP mutase family enzyme